MQAERFEDAFFLFQRSLLDAEMRRHARGSGGEAYRSHHDQHFEPYDSRRPIGVPTNGRDMQVANELDFLMVAVRNALRAQDRLPDAARTSMEGEGVLKLIRDLSEHWDEVGGRAQRLLESEHSHIDAGVINFTNKEIWIAEVPLSRIRAWAARLRQALRDALEANGLTPPEDDESIIAGDDEIEWPSDRRRRQLWTVPAIDWDDLPPEPSPEEREAVDQILALRFLNLRRRDHAD